MTPVAVDRDSQEAPFEEWWEREGQFSRAGGGQYEKTFAWNAWCAALHAALTAGRAALAQPASEPVPSMAGERERIIHTAKQAGIIAEIGRTSRDGIYTPNANALGKHVPVEWLERFAALLSTPAEMPVGELTQPDELETIIDTYVEDYEMRGEDEQGRDASYTPSEGEKGMLKDFVFGLLADADWDKAWGAHIDRLAAAKAQPERVALTDEQLTALYREHMLYQDGVTPSGLTRIARAIEAAHGIKGGQ